MEVLGDIMCIIDRNSEKIPEGDYLEICNKMKQLYSDSNKENIYNYEVPTEELYRRIKFCHRHIKKLKPFKRITKNLRELAIRKYAEFKDYELNEVSVEELERLNGEKFINVREHLFIPYLNYANAMIERERNECKKDMSMMMDCVAERLGFEFRPIDT